MLMTVLIQMPPQKTNNKFQGFWVSFFLGGGVGEGGLKAKHGWGGWNGGTV